MLRFIFLAVIAAALSGCWEGTTRDTLASILSIEGEASFSSDGGTFVALDPTHRLGEGEQLQTGPGSRLALALLPNCLIHFERETSAQIVRLTVTKDGNETGKAMLARLVELKLPHGRLLVSHVWGEARASLTIATDNGHVSTPSNALFWVESGQGRTRVTCASGWVEFQPSGAADSTRILPGSIGEWYGANGNLTPADTDPRGQNDLQQATDLEQNLRDLADRMRNVLPR